MKKKVLAKDLRKGDQLWLVNKGDERLVTINRIWHNWTTLIDYTNGTSDRFASDKDVTHEYNTGLAASKNLK